MSDNKAILANLETNYPTVRLLKQVAQFILDGDGMSRKLLMGDGPFRGQLHDLKPAEYQKLNEVMGMWKSGSKPKEIDYPLLEDESQKIRFDEINNLLMRKLGKTPESNWQVTQEDKTERKKFIGKRPK